MPYSAGYAIADIASLKALSSADLVNGYARYVISRNTWYGWNAGSTLAANDDSVVATTDAPSSGRFIRGENLNARKTITVTTPVIASGGIANIDPNLGKSFLLYFIESDKPTWVRVYHSANDRSLDSSRPDTTEVEDFNPSIKIVHEAFTTVAKPLVYFSPIRPGSSYESPPISNAPVAIKNMSGATNTISITFNVLTLES